VMARTESKLGGDSADGAAHGLGGHPVFGSLVGFRRRRRFPKRCLELCRADRSRARREMVAPASIRAWLAPLNPGLFLARRPASGSQGIWARFGRKRAPARHRFCPRCGHIQEAPWL